MRHSDTADVLGKIHVSLFLDHAQQIKVKYSDGPLDSQTWQTEWTVPPAKVQLCESENQTLEAFVADGRLSAKFDCPVARQNVSLLATAHDCEIGFHECTLTTCGHRKCVGDNMRHWAKHKTLDTKSVWKIQDTKTQEMCWTHTSHSAQETCWAKYKKL